MDDLIKRQDAITAYCEHECGIKGMTRENCGATDCGTIFDDIPSAQPDRKKGKWIPHSETCREYIGTVLVRVDYDYWFCDACGYRVEKGQPMYKFCPNCGADMRGES